MSELFAVNSEVGEALASGRPVVALETTLVTHGLPHPRGLAVAAELETTIRARGAVPATIATLDGRVRVGLSESELARLAASEATKVNLGNLAAIVSAGQAGSTTVAATMAIAHRCGIRVFATGGIGGVHRGATETADVSADLTALSRFPVAVVCAGAKAILDLPKTVETLETMTVPVLGYRTDAFPEFYRRDSGLGVDARCDSPEELARAIETHFSLGRAIGCPSGVVVANPIPENAEMPRDLYEKALAAAFALVEERKARGRAVTPLLLAELARATEGKSVSCNRALLGNNAQLAADLASALE